MSKLWTPDAVRVSAQTDSHGLAEILNKLEAELKEAKADSERLDDLEEALATDRIVSVECGYYDHETGEGGFFLCPVSGEQLCGHSIREAIDKLEEPHE
jgi:hypothetical protein